MAIGEAKDPVVILMPSLVIKRSVSLIAAFGVLASPCKYSILRPLIAAALVDHVAGNLHRLPVLEAVLGERPGQRQQNADADVFLRFYRNVRRQQAETQK